MTQWCMSHPWLTALLVYFAISAINNIGQSIFLRGKR